MSAGRLDEARRSQAARLKIASDDSTIILSNNLLHAFDIGKFLDSLAENFARIPLHKVHQTGKLSLNWRSTSYRSYLIAGYYVLRDRRQSCPRRTLATFNPAPSIVLQLARIAPPLEATATPDVPARPLAGSDSVAAGA